MKSVVEVEIKKLQGENTYFANVEIYDRAEGGYILHEFVADDFRTIWDKVTFHLMNYESKIEEFG